MVDGITHLMYPPAAVFLEPHNKTEVSLPGVENSILPITPSEASFRITNTDGKSKSVKRRQIPIMGAYTFTNYKGQGQTIENVIVDLQCPTSGSGVTSFSAYTSLSRSRGQETIRLLRGFDENIFVNHPSEALREADIALEILARDTEIQGKILDSELFAV